ncbi:MAG: hypothetical protein EZS28_016394 [Streblomastix strix]|uniref:Tyr recombinase domain-containing protein n=1 Tax=Streblomastix strix TaxID=222440 RepID=A0A5J4VZT0_9EUKA|nr:MAG: hypothetical protein EZS28_016394 [Streblomastix strix]
MNSGDGTDNERQGLKVSSRQCGFLAYGPVADVGRDQLMRSSAKQIKDQLTTVLSLVYNENLATQTASKLIKKALTNATIPHRRYQNNWNIQILFNLQKQSKQNKYLNSYDLQVKIASVQMSTSFLYPNKLAEIRLKFSNTTKTENQASLRLVPKKANAIETQEMNETEKEKLCPKLAIYEWIERLKKQFPKGTDFLLWHKGFNKPTTKKIQVYNLKKLLKELNIIGASTYQIRYLATIELAKLAISEEDLATFFHHSQNSSFVQQYYILASSTRANNTARQLPSNPGQDDESLIKAFQQRGEIRREWGNQLLSSSPLETGY